MTMKMHAKFEHVAVFWHLQTKLILRSWCSLVNLTLIGIQKQPYRHKIKTFILCMSGHFNSSSHVQV